jgi:hypothetical protein
VVSTQSTTRYYGLFFFFFFFFLLYKLEQFFIPKAKVYSVCSNSQSSEILTLKVPEQVDQLPE